MIPALRSAVPPAAPVAALAAAPRRSRSPRRPRAETGDAAGLDRLAEAAPAAIPTCSCSTSAPRSMAAAPRPIAKGHIPGAIHSDYDKAGWRVTRNDVPFMLPTRRRSWRS